MNNLIKLIQATTDQSAVIHLLKSNNVFDFVRYYLMDNYDIDWTGEYFIDEQNYLSFTTLQADVVTAIRASLE